MGLIYWWARIASRMPGIANFFTHAPLLNRVAKLVAGVAPQREMPVFAPQPFKEWFHKRGPRNTGQPKVILWPDTFNNYLHPDTAKAAVEVLETAGYQVEVPEQSLCCGRPLYDHGMLTTAKSLLRQILETLEPQITEGVPIVGLEPSCIAVFRDELLNFFPNDENARRLSKQTYLLSEFLATKVPDFHPPKLHRKALVHGHCHQKAIMRMGADEAVFKKLGLDFEILDSGCCGMAGSFGFEKDHYDVSIKCGERVLLPAVRGAASDTLIIANGFSCQEQIAQTTERRALHLAQVIQLAIHEGDSETAGTFPETRYVTRAAHRSPSRTPIAVGASAILLIGAAVMWMLRKRKPR